MWLLAFKLDDRRLDLFGQLVAITIGASGAVGYSFKPALFVTIKDLVVRLARDRELPAQASHRLSIQ